MLKQELADALNISAPMVSRLARRGMPTDSIASARRWREQNLEFSRRKEHRMPSVPRRPARAEREAELERQAADAALVTVEVLGRLANRALEAGEFDSVAPDLRAALARVPEAHRDRVRLAGTDAEWLELTGQPARTDEPAAPGDVAMPLRVWGALVGDVLRHLRAQPDFEPCELTDEQVDDAARFWYEVACGEWAPGDGRA